MAKNGSSVEQFRVIIRELNDMVDSARRTFINADTCVLSRRLLQDRLAQLEDSMPDALHQAENILQEDAALRAKTAKDCSDALNDAQTKARQMLADAQSQAAQLQQEAKAANDAAQRAMQEAQQRAQEEGNRILQQANQEANIIRAQAEHDRDQLVSQESVFQRAMVEAEEMRESTNAELTRIRQNTFDYLDGVLGRVDQCLVTLTNEVRGQRGELNDHR